MRDCIIVVMLGSTTTTGIRRIKSIFYQTNSNFFCKAKRKASEAADRFSLLSDQLIICIGS